MIERVFEELAKQKTDFRGMGVANLLLPSDNDPQEPMVALRQYFEQKAGLRG